MPKQYPRELRERAVRLVIELRRQGWHRGRRGSQGLHSVRIYDDPDQIR